MGFCYMLQYMDKLALSQATLFNLNEDLVIYSDFFQSTLKTTMTNSFVLLHRASKGRNTTGLPPSSISATLHGAGRAPISSFDCHLESTSP